MENDLMIEIHDLTKIYKIYDKPIDRLKESLSITHKQYSKEFYALKGINMEIRRGENIGIIGTNGAGKSTLLKIITGVLTPTSGSVKVNGKISALLELGAGFNPEYTGLENIYLNGTMMGYSREEVDAKVDGILEFADIGDFVHQPVKTYSSGMFARLAFAVAINVEPEILIVDEALSVGDVRFQIKCMNKMQQMMQGGTTVLFVSHDINSIRRFCSKAIWMNRGEVQEEGNVDAVADSYLDFLKFGEVLDKKTEPEEVKLPEFKPGDNLAEIISFRLLSKDGIEMDDINPDTFVRIEVIYDVYDASIENPVLGIAIRGMDDDYVCGLNTLLDHVQIPWKYGRNKMYLEYKYGLLLVGGRYYFDAALFDKTATVPIQYKTMIKQFTTVTDYVGEGRLIIPHRWEKPTM